MLCIVEICSHDRVPKEAFYVKISKDLTFLTTKFQKVNSLLILFWPHISQICSEGIRNIFLVFNKPVMSEKYLKKLVLHCFSVNQTRTSRGLPAGQTWARTRDLPGSPAGEAGVLTSELTFHAELFCYTAVTNPRPAGL